MCGSRESARPRVGHRRGAFWRAPLGHVRGGGARVMSARAAALGHRRGALRRAPLGCRGLFRPLTRVALGENSHKSASASITVVGVSPFGEDGLDHSLVVYPRSTTEHVCPHTDKPKTTHPTPENHTSNTPKPHTHTHTQPQRQHPQNHAHDTSKNHTTKTPKPHIPPTGPPTAF